LRSIANIYNLRNFKLQFSKSNPREVTISFSSDNTPQGIQVSMDMLKDFDDDGNYPVNIGGHRYLLSL
jgi:hypothetical protein